MNRVVFCGLFLLSCSSQLLVGQTTARIPVIISSKNPGNSFDPEQLAAKIAGKPAAVSSAQPLDNRHLQFVLLNDQSGNSQWPAGTAQQAFFEDIFLKNLVTPGSDHGSLVNYNDETYFEVQNATDPAVISSKIVRAGRGGTATYNAIVGAAKWLRKQPDSPDYRKMLFLFTDGDVDNASTISFKEAVKEIEETGIPVFAILPENSKKLPTTSHLTELARKSGGDIYFVGERDNGGNPFQTLREELKNETLLILEVPPDVKPGLQELTLTLQGAADRTLLAPAKVSINK